MVVFMAGDSDKLEKISQLRKVGMYIFDVTAKENDDMVPKIRDMLEYIFTHQKTKHSDGIHISPYQMGFLFAAYEWVNATNPADKELLSQFDRLGVTMESKRKLLNQEAV